MSRTFDRLQEGEPGNDVVANRVRDMTALSKTITLIYRRCRSTVKCKHILGVLSILTMSSLKEAREMLSLAWSHHFISEEEFLLLYDASFSKNPSFPHADYDRFDLDSMDEAECFQEFRVRKMDIVRLADALGLPASLCCHQRTKANRIEGLLLKRFAYPCRLGDMIHRFGRN